MDYTKIPKDFEENYYKKFVMPKAFKMKIVREDPTKFAFMMLGKRPYLYQDYFFSKILDCKKRIAMCTARQSGKSTMIGILALWATWFNKFPSGISNNTKVFIVSRTDDQAQELLAKIRELIRDGDAHMAHLTRKSNDWSTTWFTNELTEPNNNHQITFKNGSFIKSVPPSDAILGKSADILLIDEAAHLRCPDPNDFFARSAKPTVAATDGFIILSSTPKGCSGFYYQIFDPDSKYEQDESWEKIWYHYSISRDEKYLENVEKERKYHLNMGTMNKFEQEWEAKFTASLDSFFNAEKVDMIVDNEVKQDECKDDCILGVDYGFVTARTALAISRINPSNNNIETIWIKRYPAEYDTNRLEQDIRDLKERFNIVKIVVDDCPAGASINDKFEVNGENVWRFNFTREKATYYNAYRRAISDDKVRILKNFELIEEMKQLEEEESQSGRQLIHKPKGGTDDIIDAVIMSVATFLKEDERPAELILV